MTHPFIDSFNAMSEKVHQTACEKGWWEGRRAGPECIALMHSELSEALEGLRRPRKDTHCPEFSNHEVELADCIIRIMDYATYYGLEVAEALVAKAKFNDSRPYRHGGAEH